LFTITTDNATVNDVTIDYMRMKLKDKRDTILEGKFLHMRCAAHILNLVGNKCLKGLGDCVSNIRNAVDNSLKMLIFHIKISIVIIYYDSIIEFYI
jgi:hypothetical protein